MGIRTLYKTLAVSFALFYGVEGMGQIVPINVNAQYGNYEPTGAFPSYCDGDEAPEETKGFFASSANKTSGIIPEYTAQISIVLAPEVPWDGTAFDIPDGWEMDPLSTSTNLTFYNSLPWTTEDPFFMIPVRAVGPRSSTSQTVGTQVMNIGGDWYDDGLFNNTVSSVTVANGVAEGCEDPQPVTLKSFVAKRENTSINLTWSTTMETNSDRFEVERSATGKNWQKIGTVKSHGESNVLKNYDLTDANPVNGTNYYRLKMIDKDATYEYSRIVSTVFSGEVASLYPNPAVDYFKITGSINVGKVKITDLTGREIAPSKYELQADNQVKVKSMTAGIYLVSVKDVNGLVSVHKLVIGQ